MSKHCIECGERGHVILECPQFYENLMKPSPGTCARCGGRGTFMPYVKTAATAVLLCACCSYPECPHKTAPVAA